MLKFVLLSYFLLIPYLRAEVFFGSPEKGTGCGETCSWSFDDETGILNITGSGKMTDFTSGQTPWQNIMAEIRTVNMGDQLTSVGENAFREANNLTSVHISTSAISLGTRAFYKTALTSVTIPDGVTSVGNYTFSNCTNLTDVQLSDSLTEIVWKAFYNDIKLANIDIPEGVSAIGFGAFSRTALSSLVIPPSVTDLKDIFTAAKYEDGTSTPSNTAIKQLTSLYCPKTLETKCQEILNLAQKDFKPTIYEKEGNDYLVYDSKGNIVGKYASVSDLKDGKATERYKYDTAGHLVGIFDGNGQRTWGKKIYTVEEAMKATENGDKFHVFLTYK